MQYIKIRDKGMAEERICYYKDEHYSLLHREDGPAVEWTNGVYKAWCINGRRHREDGPAVTWADGQKEWWINGERHREDGPAIEFKDGNYLFYLNGIHYIKEQYWSIIKFGGFV